MPASLVAVGTAVSTWWAGVSMAGVASLAARTLLTIGLTKLIANKAGDTGAGTSANGGARIQLPPATDNKLPVIYGTAFAAPIITDAKISSDNKTMWYVCALSEVTDSGTLSFGNIYYDGKLVTFDGTDHTKVVSLTTNASPAQEDTSCNGSLYIYGYNNGSNSPVNTSLTAIQVLQDAGIPADYRWTSTDLMTDCAFIIVKIIYNQNSGLTNLGQLQVEITNSLTKPGDVINDYLQNERYGCGIPSTQIDSASISALNTYSDVLIPYTDVDGNPATQPRYRINGPINTGNNCMTNLQQLVDACDTWLQYSELTGKWKFVINESYEQAGQTLDDLFLVDSSNLIGGINITPLDLNGTYNQLEIQYPNTNVRDQTDFIALDLVDYQAALLSPNEPQNKLTVQLPQVNNYVQAYYLGVRRLLQSREDLAISCTLDFSGIQIEAGDVIRVTLEEYGWDEKLFRVSQVQEAKTEDGNLGAHITAFEYNSTIYSNDAIDDFIPAANTGLTDPNILSAPGTPAVATSDLFAGNIASFTVTSTIPTGGQTLYLDFNYGTSSDISTHKLYRTVTDTSGQQFTPGASVVVTINDLPAGTYYFSTKARNKQQGRSSASSSGYVWSGMNITPYTSTIKSNASSSGNVVYVDTTNVIAGQNVLQNSGSGALAAGTKVLAILSAGSLLLDKLPTSNLGNAVLDFFGGGVSSDNLGPGLAGYNFIGNYYVFNNAGAAGVPVEVSTRTNFTDPFYLTGTDPGSSYIWPWQQGTSSTADGYFSNSTSPYEPYTAALIANWNNGDYDYWVLCNQSFSENPFTTDESLEIKLSCQVFTDTPNTLVQIVPYYDFGGASGNVLQTQSLTTYELTSTSPVNNEINYFDVTTVAADALAQGFAVRVITGGATVTFTKVSWVFNQINS